MVFGGVFKCFSCKKKIPVLQKYQSALKIISPKSRSKKRRRSISGISGRHSPSASPKNAPYGRLFSPKHATNRKKGLGGRPSSSKRKKGYNKHITSFYRKIMDVLKHDSFNESVLIDVYERKIVMNFQPVKVMKRKPVYYLFNIASQDIVKIKFEMVGIDWFALCKFMYDHSKKSFNNRTLKVYVKQATMKSSYCIVEYNFDEKNLDTLCHVLDEMSVGNK